MTMQDSDQKKDRPVPGMIISLDISWLEIKTQKL